MLLSIAGKVLNTIILERLKVVVDKGLKDEQVGSRNTTFVNFEKPFDSIDREVLWNVLHRYGILEKYVHQPYT